MHYKLYANNKTHLPLIDVGIKLLGHHLWKFIIITVQKTGKRYAQLRSIDDSR